jgi:FKBP-type peptidyl-prolyl cis-trans isomerase FkpA
VVLEEEMKRRALVLVMLIAGLSGCKAGEEASPSPSPSAAASDLKDEHEKTVYALGVMLGRNLEPLALTPAELDLVKKGLGDVAAGQKPKVELEVYGPKIQELAQSRTALRAKEEKGRSQSFAEAAAQQPGAVRTASGLVFRTLTPGKGASPTASDTVRVHYTGTLTDGKEFDSSVRRGQPVEFPLNGVIPCWTEGVQRMKVGEKARLVCPSDIAYGDQGRPPVIPGGATLVFEVELLGIKK